MSYQTISSKCLIKIFVLYVLSVLSLLSLLPVLSVFSVLCILFVLFVLCVLSVLSVLFKLSVLSANFCFFCTFCTFCTFNRFHPNISWFSLVWLPLLKRVGPNAEKHYQCYKKQEEVFKFLYQYYQKRPIVIIYVSQNIFLELRPCAKVVLSFLYRRKHCVSMRLLT